MEGSQPSSRNAKGHNPLGQLGIQEGWRSPPLLLIHTHDSSAITCFPTTCLSGMAFLLYSDSCPAGGTWCLGRVHRITDGASDPCAQSSVVG